MSDKDLMERVQPFSSGTEYHNWLLNNCRQCKWGSNNNNYTKVCTVEYTLEEVRYTDCLVSRWIMYVAGIGKGGKCKVMEREK